jgi:asparagine synthase (glutamine-hydrolysing)
MFKFDLQHYLQALLASEDRLSMAFSVESRVPLLDHRVAELAGQLGAHLKMQPGHSKAILRRAMRGIVPDEILNRRDKRGFPTPIGAWLRDPALGLLETFVFSDNPFARQYFDLKRLRQLAESRTYFSTDWSERLWRVLTLCVWGNVFRLG